MAEETLPFFAILMPIMMAMGFDSITAFMTVFVGARIGYIASTVNPFNVLISQGILGIQGNPSFGCVLLPAVLTAVAVAWVVMYALKVKKNPKRPPLSTMISRNAKSLARMNLLDSEFTAKQKAVMVIFVLGLGAIIWGLVAQGWYMNEISAIFLAMALLSGVVSGMNEKEIAGEFVKGGDCRFRVLCHRCWTCPRNPRNRQ